MPVVRAPVFNAWLACPADTLQSPIRIKAAGRSGEDSVPAPGASAPQKTVGTQPCPVRRPLRHNCRNGRTDTWLAAAKTAPTPLWFTARAHPPDNAVADSAASCPRVTFATVWLSSSRSSREARWSSCRIGDGGPIRLMARGQTPFRARRSVLDRWLFHPKALLRSNATSSLIMW